MNSYTAFLLQVVSTLASLSAHISTELCKVELPSEKYFEKPEISIAIPKNQQFYALPGQDQVVELYLTNNGYENVDLLVSYRENFYNPTNRHVEFGRGIHPRDVKDFGFNETRLVQFKFKVPNHVRLGTQSKVTLVLKPSLTQTSTGSLTGSYITYSKAFYIVASDQPLSKYDKGPPQCRIVCNEFLSLCKDLDQVNCNSSIWQSYVEIYDNLTGLRGADLRNETFTLAASGIEMQVPRALEIGSRQIWLYRFQADCCTRGFKVEMRDMADNMGECRIGENGGVVRKAQLLTYLTISLLLFRLT